MPDLKNFYQQHCENLIMIEKGIKTIQRTLREYISNDDTSRSYVYTRILSQLVNSWIEVRLMKLVYTNGAFTDSEKIKIIESRTLKKKWITALNLAFCKAFGLNDPTEINETNLTLKTFEQHSSLLRIIQDDLVSAISIRNKIAHGQWKYAFTNSLKNINNNLTNELGKENILVLQYRLRMFQTLTQIIHDLGVSKRTFERDFNNNFNKIENQRKNSARSDYEEYKKRMIRNKQYGLEKKEKHKKKDCEQNMLIEENEKGECNN